MNQFLQRDKQQIAISLLNHVNGKFGVVINANYASGELSLDLYLDTLRDLVVMGHVSDLKVNLKALSGGIHNTVTLVVNKSLQNFCNSGGFLSQN